MEKLSNWKINILKHNFDIEQDFSNYPNIKKYKTKYKTKNIKVINEKFLDTSKDHSLIPSELIISNRINSTLVKCNYNKTSKYKLNFNSKNIFVIEKNSGKILDLELSLIKENPALSECFNLNNKKWSVNDFVQIVGLNRISIMPYDGCTHWNKKAPCKFCDSNPKKYDHKSPVPSLNTLQKFKSSDEWWNYYKKEYLAGLCLAYSKLTENLDKNQTYHFQFMTGNIHPSNKAWDITIEIIKKLNKIYPIKNFNTYLNLGYIKENQKEYLQKMKLLGFKQIQLNLEVIGNEQFNETCPGKSKILNYYEVIEFLKKAVKVFGKGNARSNFVFGLQNNEELLDGIKELAKHGIVADYSLFIPKPGTSYSLKPRPEFNNILNFSKALVEIYKKNNFEPIYDRFSSRSNALHELLLDI
jgi:hypothetical protein